jgi:surfactin synthase thioesterase subunit
LKKFPDTRIYLIEFPFAEANKNTLSSLRTVFPTDFHYHSLKAGGRRRRLGEAPLSSLEEMLVSVATAYRVD